MFANDFTELRVYQHGFELAMEVFEISKAWPREERYALTDQIRRSSRSVCANIAESWFKRRYPKHFASKLTDATQEAAECVVWIQFADECGYVDSELAQRMKHRYRRIIGGLVKMTDHADEWCGPSTSVREQDIGYAAD